MDYRYEAFREALRGALFPEPVGPGTGTDDPEPFYTLRRLNKTLVLLNRLSLRRPFANPDEAIQALVTEAITEYGSAVRDIIKAIYIPYHQMDDKLGILPHESLVELVEILIDEGLYWKQSDSELFIRYFTVSRLFITDQDPDESDKLLVQFKSARIGQRVVEYMVVRLEEEEFRELFSPYVMDPGRSTYILEMFAHRMMCRKEPECSILSRVGMSSGTSIISNAPNFLATLSYIPSPASFNPYPTRTFRMINIREFLEDKGALDLSAYYVLEAKSALFDAFFIQVEVDKTSAPSQICFILWLSKLTTQEPHGSLSSSHDDDYDTVKCLVDLIVLQAEPLAQSVTLEHGNLTTNSESPTQVLGSQRPQVTTQVNVIFVCSYQSGEEVRVDIPEGWDALQKYTTHASRVFCQPIRTVTSSNTYVSDEISSS